ncbi:MAG: hypothetical protein RMK45_04650 [Armatimonadota bacterium]|nr:hypothetical protein [Armatimonadota bacterium]
MEWTQLIPIVSALVGWAFVLTRQILHRMDKLVESAQRQEQAITDEFIAYLRESIARTEATYERLELALDDVREALVSLRHAIVHWQEAHKP